MPKRMRGFDDNGSTTGKDNNNSNSNSCWCCCDVFCLLLSLPLMLLLSPAYGGRGQRISELGHHRWGVHMQGSAAKPALLGVDDDVASIAGLEFRIKQHIKLKPFGY